MTRWLSPTEVKQFIQGNLVDNFNPDTGEQVATSIYQADGRCRMSFAKGDADGGVYGFEDNVYWTRYKTFRDGQRHTFRLEHIDEGKAQAYFGDGSKAFLQVVAGKV